jgi:hypothetical protein
MKNIKKVLIYGFFIWMIPFLASILAYSFHDTNRALFESVMAVVVTATVVFFSIRYFKDIESDYLKEAAQMGAIWYVISVAIDMLMFSTGPMAMSISDYFADIGLTYLIYPIVTLGFGWILDRR